MCTYLNWKGQGQNLASSIKTDIRWPYSRVHIFFLPSQQYQTIPLVRCCMRAMATTIITLWARKRSSFSTCTNNGLSSHMREKHTWAANSRNVLHVSMKISQNRNKKIKTTCKTHYSECNATSFAVHVQSVSIILTKFLHWSESTFLLIQVGPVLMSKTNSPETVWYGPVPSRGTCDQCPSCGMPPCEAETLGRQHQLVLPACQLYGWSSAGKKRARW